MRRMGISACVQHGLLLLALCWLAQQAAGAKTVHVVFSNHLDIGFNNIEPLIAYDYNVYLKYWHEYFPRAVQVASFMEYLTGGSSTYVYTTAAYMVSLFMDCPPGRALPCPSKELRDLVAAGVRKGTITWHAHPHNAQYEVYDASLLEASVDMVHTLDAAWGQPLKRTLVLRDVPGLTRAAIPVLVGKGVRAVSVGVNPGSAPPGVPQYTPFIWRDEESGTQLMAFWRPGGYGGIHKGVNLDPPHQCIQAPGLRHVLCTAWRDDNAGPPTNISEPLKIYELLREEWGPDAVITASSLDTFVDQVYAALPQLNLTVVTGEIGDTWVFGVQSDPRKVADFRAISRARAACLADPSCPTQGLPELSRMLLKVPEHTWGLDVKKALHDFVNWTNADFHACLAAPRCPNYQALITSWERQAAYLDWGLQALPPAHPILSAVDKDTQQREALAGLSTGQLVAGGAVEVPLGRAHTYTTPHWELTLDERSGGLTRLLRRYPHQPPVTLPPTRTTPQPPHIPLPQQQPPHQQHRHQQRQLQSGLKPIPPASTSSSRRGSRREWGLFGAAACMLQRAVGLLRWSSWASSGACGNGTPWGQAPSTPTQTAAAAAAGAPHQEGGGGSQDGQQPPAAKDFDQGVDWAAGAPTPLSQLVYNVYSEADYDVIWDRYSWAPHPLPWWFEQDFGKVNSSLARKHGEEAQARLTGLFELWDPPTASPATTSSSSSSGSSSSSRGQQPKGPEGGGRLVALYLRYAFPDHLVREAGAPPLMWQVLSFPADTPELGVAVAWQGKPPTRLPEALWLSWAPGPAAHPASWAMQKINSRIHPHEVIVNGSQSMHAIYSISVTSRHPSSDAATPVTQEVLNITTWDTALVSPGHKTPFPIGDTPPHLAAGMHFNLVNNVWGTNYVMWVPWSDKDVNLAFRWTVRVEQLQQGGQGGTGGRAAAAAAGEAVSQGVVQ